MLSISDGKAIRIELTNKEIDECIAKGIAEHKLCVRMGWTYRHDGMPSPKAHGQGNFGEVATHKWLRANNIPFKTNYYKGLPKSIDDLRHDIYVGEKLIGVKTASPDQLKKLCRNLFKILT